MLTIKIAEGALLPQRQRDGVCSARVLMSTTQPGLRQFNAELLGTLTIPIYQGGADYATIRQSKENLSVQELHAEFARATRSGRLSSPPGD